MTEEELLMSEAVKMARLRYNCSNQRSAGALLQTASGAALSERTAKMHTKFIPLPLPASSIERFWSKVNRDGGPSACWPWMAARIYSGYGRFSISRSTFGAHRVAFAIATGRDIPPGSLVCHRCDNPSCCNPDHLFVGSDSDNAFDRERKGRRRRLCGAEHPLRKNPVLAARGERVASALLTEQSVREIREIAKSGSVSHEALSRRYGVSRPTISMVVERKTWRHVL